MEIRWISVRVRPIDSPAKPLGAPVIGGAGMTIRKMKVSRISVMSTAIIEYPCGS